MDRVYELHVAEIKPPAAAVVQRMGLLQPLFAEPHGDFIIGDDGRAGTLGDVRCVGHVVRVAVRDEDIVRVNRLDVNSLGQLVAGDERVEQQRLVRDLRRKA